MVSLRVVGSPWESMGLIRIDSTHLGLGNSVALGSIHCESRWSPGVIGVVGSPWESAGVIRID